VKRSGSLPFETKGIANLPPGAAQAVPRLWPGVLPSSRPGRLRAWRTAAGGLIAAVLAYVSGKYLTGANVLGNGYATTFILAFFLTSAGLWFLQHQIREPIPPTIREPVRLRDRMRDIPGLIAADRGYRWFLVMQMLATSARIATPFYILHVGATMHLDGATLGLLSLAYLGADTVSNIVWGYLGDRKGFRVVLVLAITIWIAATLLLLTLHAPLAVFVAFFGLGAAAAGYMMASQTMILEFGHRYDLSMRIGSPAPAEGGSATIGPPFPFAKAPSFDSSSTASPCSFLRSFINTLIRRLSPIRCKKRPRPLHHKISSIFRTPSCRQ